MLKHWCFWNVVLEKTLESPLDCKEIQPVHSKGDQSWVFFGRTNAKAETLATSWEELTHWKRPWCWEGLGAGGEGDNRGWDGWMVSPTRWTWVWVNSGSWWWTGRPGVLRFMGSQRVGHDWATELNWTEGASLVAQTVKNPPAMQETRVRSLVGKILWRRERLPTPVFFPGDFHGLYSLCDHKESDMTEWLSLSFSLTHRKGMVVESRARDP